MITFIVVGAIGIVLILIGLIADGLLDFLDIGDGFFSATTLGVAMLIFGSSGLIARASDLPDSATYLIAGGIGIMTVLIVGFFMRHLSRQNARVGVEYSLVGMRAIVTSETSEDGGEVAVDDSRESGRRLATSATTLAEGTQVRVIEHSGSRVRVAPYVETEGR